MKRLIRKFSVAVAVTTIGAAAGWVAGSVYGCAADFSDPDIDEIAKQGAATGVVLALVGKRIFSRRAA